MKCPTCKTDMNGMVIDSRQYTTYTRRRRECTICGTRWTTYEEIDEYSIKEKKTDEDQTHHDGVRHL